MYGRSFHHIDIKGVSDNIHEFHVRYKVNDGRNYNLRSIQVDVHMPMTSNYPMEMSDRVAKSNIIDVIQGITRPTERIVDRSRIRRLLRDGSRFGSTSMTIDDFVGRQRWSGWDD